MRVLCLLVVALFSTAPVVGAQAAIGARAAAATAARPDGVHPDFPPPRLALTVGGGQLAHVGRLYNYASASYHHTRFKPGPAARADLAVHVMGPLSVRASVARAWPRWETRSDGCGECGYPGIIGLHTVQLTFYDAGARVSLWRSETWPQEEVYAEYRIGKVRQQLLSHPFKAVPGARATNGTHAWALGGVYSLPWRFALTLQVEDQLTRYTPIDFALTSRRRSQTLLLTAGITWRSF